MYGVTIRIGGRTAGVKAMRSAGGVAPVVARLQAWLSRADGAEQVEALTRVLAVCTSVDKRCASSSLDRPPSSLDSTTPGRALEC